MDVDLDHLSREQLVAEVRKLRQGIREHRDSTGHDLCWHHPALWSLLPEQSDPLPVVPEWPEFLRGCLKYRESLDAQAPHAPRTDQPFADADAAPPDPAIHRLYEQILLAWNQRDAGAMAACFAEDGNLVGFDGSQVDSRRAIEDHLRPIFAHHPTPAYVGKAREIRMLAPAVALLRAVAGMAARGSGDLDPALNTVHTLVARAHGEGWRAALFQSTPAAWHGRPRDGAALTEELREVLRHGATSG